MLEIAQVLELDVFDEGDADEISDARPKEKAEDHAKKVMAVLDRFYQGQRNASKPSHGLEKRMLQERDGALAVFDKRQDTADIDDKNVLYHCMWRKWHGLICFHYCLWCSLIGLV